VSLAPPSRRSFRSRGTRVVPRQVYARGGGKCVGVIARPLPIPRRQAPELIPVLSYRFAPCQIWHIRDYVFTRGRPVAAPKQLAPRKLPSDRRRDHPILPKQRGVNNRISWAHEGPQRALAPRRAMACASSH